jgi:hypothetical protein
MLEMPGQGEIVGGEISRLADSIAKMARQKGGKDRIEMELKRIERMAEYQGERCADERHTKNVQHMSEAITDKIVCSAIATLEAQMNTQRGLPPALFMSAYTICRMLDALGRAGYTAEGKK